ncbi:MAG: type II toxin-antitoxin system VapC family toxin [Gemmataceae bacterium]
MTSRCRTSSGWATHESIDGTHTFIWMDNEPKRLSSVAAAALSDPANEVFLSIVSVWEIIIKVQAGKIILRAPLSQMIADQQANQVHVLSVILVDAVAIETLPPVHKDPFDRLLAAQSIAEDMELVTADPIFAQYPVRVLW